MHGLCQLNPTTTSFKNAAAFYYIHITLLYLAFVMVLYCTEAKIQPQCSNGIYKLCLLACCG